MLSVSKRQTWLAPDLQSMTALRDPVLRCGAYVLGMSAAPSHSRSASLPI